MLKIKNLHASVEDKSILKGINLEVKAGEVHAIMGPNGSGKSTLAAVIAGKDEYEATEGSIFFDGENIDELAAEERAHKGIFLSFQYPVEIPGVSVTNFMKTAINESVDLLQSGQYDEIKKLVDGALKAGMERNLGHDYQIDIEKRMSEMARDTVKTNWEVIDQLLSRKDINTDILDNQKQLAVEVAIHEGSKYAVNSFLRHRKVPEHIRDNYL